MKTAVSVRNLVTEISFSALSYYFPSKLLSCRNWSICLSRNLVTVMSFFYSRYLGRTESRNSIIVIS